ncbi:hypothetical protein SH1V18_11810 [Vallitalea longa]|uniref:Peptidase S54 rhomboid domain-containing protein n=1 Tax=Vallitalea longa TaxID=2936439 RepID=A0A9W5Y9Q6_9FIRM|nr:rhomboid family intramembrane serine protease [Vallitalea longa]GKX28701.1 hypothetical protein SH1V18_11810 [Vallitalea longa]
MNTFEKICNLFDNYNYQIIQTNTNDIKTYSTYSHSNLYLINIVTMNNPYTYSKDRIDQFRSRVDKQLNNINANKIIILNLLITDDSSNIYDDINYTPDFEEHIIDVNWIIDNNEEKLIIPSMQMNDVIGIQKNLKKILKDNNNGYKIKKVQKNNDKPYLTYIFIAINVLVWIYMEINGGSTDIYNLIRFGSVDSYSVFIKGEYYRIITSMFIHIGISHLIFNCFALYIFGTRMERYMKKWKYLLLYMMSGILGGLISITVDLLNNRAVISAGASGAIYGILGAILVYSRIYKREVGGLSYYTILIMLIAGIAFGFMDSSISNIAHLGGFVSGGLIAFLYSLTNKGLEK